MTTPHLQHFFPFFFFNDTATTEIYTLSLHDALPILLKTGGAYLPLDPEYPSERIAFMIEDAQAQVILTQSRLLDRLPNTVARAVCMDADWPVVSSESDEKIGRASCRERV